MTRPIVIEFLCSTDDDNDILGGYPFDLRARCKKDRIRGALDSLKGFILREVDHA